MCLALYYIQPFAQMTVFSKAGLLIPEIHSFTCFDPDQSVGYTTICANECIVLPRCAILGIHCFPVAWLPMSGSML